MAIALVVGLLIGAGATYALAGPSLGRTTTSVITTTETLPVVTITSTTTVATTTEVQSAVVTSCITTSSKPIFPCGGDNFLIDSASLFSSNGGNGTLAMTLTHSENFEGDVVWIYVNRTVMLTTPAVGAEHTYIIQVPSRFVGQSGALLSQTISLTAGSKYEVIVNMGLPDGRVASELRIFLIAS